MTSSIAEVKERRLWLLLGTLVVLILMLIVPRLASARGTFMSSWDSAYPSSTSADNVINGTGNSCQLCHRDSNGGNGWNTYGWDIWLEMNDNSLSIAAAIAAAEDGNADSDPTGSSNLAEINANTQPGWTEGPNNRIFIKDRSFTDGNSPPAAILGNLDPVNTAPVAVGDAYSTSENVTLTTAAPGVLGNDSDLDSDPLTAVLVSDVLNGSLTLNSNGSFTYIPNAGFSGSDSFLYKANDGALDSNTVTVSITINPINDPPVATADTYTTDEDITLNITAPGVLGNDTDPESDPLTAVLVSDVLNGSLTLNPNGSFTYIPNAGFSGSDSFLYNANDGALDSNTVTVSITINPINDPPVATADTYTTDEDITLNIAAPGVLGNDTDPESDPLTAALVSDVSNGSLTLNPNGSFTYTPTANFNGADSFTYRASDGNQTSAITTVSITVNAINDPPVATDDAYTTDEDITLNIAAPGVLGNDTDPESDPLVAALVSDVSSGALTLNADGSFTYIPNAGFSGSDSFTYRASDGNQTSAITTVSITVNPINDPPVATADTYTTDEDITLNIAAPGVLGNDTDPESDPLVAALVSDVSSGALTLNADGSFTYTPTANFNGADSFTYRASDGNQTSAITTVSITVNPINDPPVATADTYTTDEDITLNIAAPGVLDNDTDPESDPLTAALVSDVSNGSLTLNPNGSFTYTPTTNFNGADSFTYRASDGNQTSAITTVSITVNPINDPPVATADTYTTDEDITLNIAAPGVLDNDTDPESDPLTAALVSDVSNGSLTLNPNGSFTYTPTANFNGADSFTYRASDGNQTSAITTVSITVNPVNDPPVATADTYTTNQDTTLNVGGVGVLNNDADLDGDPLSAVLVSDVGSGALTLNADGSFTYIPNAGFSGSDSFTYQANDGALDSNTVTVNITINAGAAPIANDDAYTTDEDIALVRVAPGVLGNDVGSGTLTAVLVGDVTSGTLTLTADGSFSYIPNANYNGSDSFTYVTNDGTTDSNLATVSITINPVNDPPVATDDAYTTDEDVTLNIAASGVLGNDTDPESDPLTAALLTDVTSGSLTLSADGSFDYIPNADFNGTDSFTYEARDGNGGATPGTVTITVNPINDPPVATDDAYTTDEDIALVRVAPGVLGNDTDPDGDTLTAVLVGDVTSGTLTLTADGSFSYIPNANYNGSDSFTYVTNDGTTDSNLATVSITINPVNDPPVATDDAYTTDEDVTLNIAASGVLGNDTDPESDPLTAALLTDVTSGSLTLSADGSFDYIPNADFNGTDSFTYEARDGNGGATPGTVTITVNPINDPPVATDDAYTTDEDIALVRVAPGVLGNDTDPDGDTLTAVLVGDVTSGTLTLTADGSFSYIPNANYNGSDSFTYVTNDGTTDSNLATVSITINPVNDPPVATDDAYTTDEDVTLNIAASGVLGNDTDPESDPLTAALLTDVTSGSLTLSADGSFDYIPNADFNGTDSFTYEARDGNGGATPGTVTITVNPINDPPVATDDAYTTDEDIALVRVAPGVLGNDTDPDGDTLTAVLVGDVTSGTLTLTADGSFSYIPNANYNGSDSFTYVTNDGTTDSNLATVSITINPVNDPPVADPGGPYPGTASIALSVDGSASSDPDGSIVSHVWDFGDGAIASGSVASHTYVTGGTFTITLTVTDDGGASNSATTTATILAPPVADAGGPYTGVIGAPVSLTGAASSDPDGSITSYAWNFGDSASGTGITIGHTYGSAGTYTVTLTVTDDDGFTATDTAIATIGSLDGGAIYSAECASCHGASGEGGIGPSLQASTLSLSQIVAIVTDGQGSMPAFSSTLTTAQIDSVGSHALGLQVTGATTTTTTTVPPDATGSQIYSAECASCHGASGEGGIGPSLQASTLSLSQIVAIVTDGQGFMPGFSGKLTAAQIDSVGNHALDLQVAGATTTTSTTVPPGATGGQIYAAECAGCHGSTGGGGIGPSLQASTLSTSQIASIVTGGQGTMPGFSSKLTSTQIQSVSAHAAGLQVAGATTTTTTLPATANGSEIYAAKCAACHGANGEGGIGPSLQASTMSLSQIISIMTNGQGTMPAITDLTTDQMQAVASHAQGLQIVGVTTTSTTSTTLAPGADGADIYAANCAACHGADLSGGIGPSLLDTSLDTEAIIDIIANGKGTMPPLGSTLSASQIEDVAAFVGDYDPNAVTEQEATSDEDGATIAAVDVPPPVVTAIEPEERGFLVNALLVAFLLAGGALLGGVGMYLWRTRADV